MVLPDSLTPYIGFSVRKKLGGSSLCDSSPSHDYRFSLGLRLGLLPYRKPCTSAATWSTLQSKMDQVAAIVQTTPVHPSLDYRTRSLALHSFCPLLVPSINLHSIQFKKFNFVLATLLLLLLLIFSPSRMSPVGLCQVTRFCRSPCGRHASPPYSFLLLVRPLRTACSY